MIFMNNNSFSHHAALGMVLALVLLGMALSPVSGSMFRADPAHSGVYDDSDIIPNNQLRWSFTTGNSVYSSPAVINDTVYVGSYDSKVYAINATTGTKLWDYTTGGSIESSPAVVNGVVYVGSNDKKVYAINATNGTKLWDYTTESLVKSSPAVSNGVVYVGDLYKNLSALDATTGTKIWDYPIGGVYSSPVVAGSVVYIGGGDAKVYAFIAATGTKLWEYTTGGPVESSPAVSNGVIYVSGGSFAVGMIYALNAATGTKIWEYETTGQKVRSSPAVVNGTVYVVGGQFDNKIYAFNAATGTKIWGYPIGGGQSSPAVSNGVIYVGSESDKVYAINATTGTKIWEYMTGSVVQSSPALSNGVVYVGCGDSKVYAIGFTPPTITTITPDSSGVGEAAFNLTITGSNFTAKSRVTWNGTDRTTYYGSATNLKAWITDADLSTAGNYPVQVQDDPIAISNTRIFTVAYPEITVLTPDCSTAGAAAFNLTITGTNFTAKSIVTWNGTDKTTYYDSSTSLKAWITDTDLTRVGSYPIQVRNYPDALSNTKHFNITSVVPAYGQNTETLKQVTITGPGLETGSTVILTNSSFTIPGTITFQNDTIIKSSFPLSGAPIRIYDLNIRTPGGKTYTLKNAFTVTNASPTINTITPSSGFNTSSIQVTITGTAFRGGVSISLMNKTTIIPGIITNRTSTRILATFILTGTTPGTYNLNVLNSDGLSGTKQNAFSVLSPGSDPTITGFTPTSGVNTAALPFTINGLNFRTGATVTITNRTTTKTVTGTVSGNTSIKCSLPLSGLSFGIYNLTVRNTDGSSVTRENEFNVTNPVPSISTFTPMSGYANGPVTVTISGSKFVSGAGISLVSGGSSIPGSITSFTNTKIIGTFILAGAEPGSYNLTVTNPGGPNAKKPFSIQSSGSDPTINSLTPDSGVNTASLPLTIIGTNYRAGASVTITNGTTNRTVTGTLTNNTTIKCTLPLAGLPYGLYNVTVRNKDGSNGTRVNGFTVNNPTPVITIISPGSGYTSGPIAITITGSKFVTGAGIMLVTGGTTIPGSITSFTATKITGIFNLTGAVTGIYNLTVVNPGGPNATKPFSIQSPGTEPTINNITPASGVNTASLPLTITGTNFRARASVTITNGTTNRTVSGTLTNNTTIKCTLPLAGLPFGLYNVTVRNSDGSNGTKEYGFSVNNPSPAITSISPAFGFTPGSATVTITGSKFVSGAAISLINGTTTIPGMITSFTGTKIVGTFILTGEVPGTYNLAVTNPGGPSATKPFIIHSPDSEPTIASLTPDSGVNEAPLQVTITGTNYRAGVTVTITNGTTNRTVSGTLSGNTTIRCTLPLKELPYGQYNVTVRNSDGSNGTKENRFTIRNPVPVITSVTPLSGYNTNSVSVTILGTKFASGASISLVNGNTTITGTVVSLSATSITGSFLISGLLPGKYNLSVKNPIDIKTTKPNAFTVIAHGTAPVINAISPASGFNNAKLPVTIAGSNFNKPVVYINQGSLLKLAPATAGKTPTATAVYVTLPLAGVPGGLYNITIRNSDGVNTTAEDIFYVTDQAWLSSKNKTSARSPVVQQAGLPKAGTPATSLVIAGQSGRQVITGAGI